MQPVKIKKLLETRLITLLNHSQFEQINAAANCINIVREKLGKAFPGNDSNMILSIMK